MPTAKAPAKGTKKAAGPAKKVPSESEQLLAALTKALGVDAAEVELRALRELAAHHHIGEKPAEPAKAAPHAAPKTGSSGLPRRPFVLLDGRGMDGRGLPIEVMASPTLIGSGRMCTIWVNSPQIETRHLQLTEEDEGWVLSDLHTEKGTLFNGKPLARRVLEDGDEFQLAGYLRMRIEFR